MASSSVASNVKELKNELTDIGNQLLNPPSEVDEVLDILDGHSQGKLNAVGDVQPADDAGKFSNEEDAEEIAFDNAVVKMKEAISHEAEGNHRNDKSTFEEHGNEEVGSKVSVSSDAIILKDNDGTFSAKGAKTERKRKRAPRKNEESEKRSRGKNKGEELVGLKIKVWWPLDRRFYEGVISSYNSSKKKHKVEYIDGDVENLNLRRERWELVDEDASTDKEPNAGSPPVSGSKQEDSI